MWITGLMLGATMLGAAGASAAEPAPVGKPACVIVTLLNTDNLPIETPQPTIGMMIAGRPMIVGAVPGFSGMSVGASTPCSAELVNEANATYAGSCLTEERRKQTATTYRIDAKGVAENCKALRAALGDALETAAR